MQIEPTIIKSTTITDLDIVMVFLDSLSEDDYITPEEHKLLLGIYPEVFQTVEPFYRPHFQEVFVGLLEQEEDMVYVEDYVHLMRKEFTIEDVVSVLRELL